MDFSLDDDQVALRDAVQRWCDGEYEPAQRGAAEDAAVTRRRWRALGELGLLGLVVDADHGGSGLGAAEAMLAAHELGRVLGGGAWIASSIMAARLLQALASPAQRAQWLPAIASGEVQASLALYEEGARHDWARCALRARAHDRGWILDGRKQFIEHGDSARLLLVLARIDAAQSPAHGTLRVFAVDSTARGLQLQPYTTLDGRTGAHATFTGTQLAASGLLGHVNESGAAPSHDATDAVGHALDAGIAALCAEAAGAVEALVTLTAEHLRTRRQFGSPLSRFQVLQHRLADMAIALEQLRSMACAAAMAVQEGTREERARIVSAAKVLAGELGRRVALDAIQMHGAMGMTDECRVGHYAKRLMVIGQMHGDAAWHLQRVDSHPRAAADRR